VDLGAVRHAHEPVTEPLACADPGLAAHLHSVEDAGLTDHTLPGAERVVERPGRRPDHRGSIVAVAALTDLPAAADLFIRDDDSLARHAVQSVAVVGEQPPD